MVERIYSLLIRLLNDQENVTITYDIVNESEVKNGKKI